MNKPIILGLNAGGHDTAAAVMIGPELVAAMEEERFTLIKHTTSFPSNAIAACLKAAGISMEKVDAVAIGFDPNAFIRETYLQSALESDERLEFLVRDLDSIRHIHNLANKVRQETGFQKEPLKIRHHLCHLASTYFPSGFDHALIASYDGIAENETGMLAVGHDGQIERFYCETRYPDSLGLFYSAITFYLGWKHHCDEGIIMGLAPFGDPNARVPEQDRTYIDIFREIIPITGDYSYSINRKWIAYHQVRDTWVSRHFLDAFGPKRDYKDPLTRHHKNIAAALQTRLEEVVLHQLTIARKRFGLKKLCLAGGVALNCSMNGKIEKSRLFDELFVQPASGDQGVAVGACLLAYQKMTGIAPLRKNHDFYKGSGFTTEETEEVLQRAGVPYVRPSDLYAETARQLADGRIVGWFQGRAEFGPRALGNRSILCRPFPGSMRDTLNMRVKFREEFRPFAPAVLAERAQQFFQIMQESPHMLIACDVVPEKKSEIAAVVHVDGTCRVQTVRPENNPRFRRLLEAFDAVTGCPVILNTSFNVKGQPIVDSPKQALDCFLGTNIDYLVLGDFVVDKAKL
ncbi:MAG: carbamoyl transferase [Betaproteobacteria bacterium]|nr:carbamoyl transferase [Betaproteobacteria bacterium]